MALVDGACIRKTARLSVQGIQSPIPAWRNSSSGGDVFLFLLFPSFFFVAGAILFDDLDWESLVCACHRLQNAVKTALTNSGSLLDKLFAKSRKVVGHFHHSNLATEALLKEQREAGISRPKKLEQDVPTRWNSSFYMLQRLVELRTHVSNVLS